MGSFFAGESAPGIEMLSCIQFVGLVIPNHRQALRAAATDPSIDL